MCSAIKPCSLRFVVEIQHAKLHTVKESAANTSVMLEDVVCTRRDRILFTVVASHSERARAHTPRQLRMMVYFDSDVFICDLHEELLHVSIYEK